MSALRWKLFLNIHEDKYAAVWNVFQLFDGADVTFDKGSIPKQSRSSSIFALW